MASVLNILITILIYTFMITENEFGGNAASKSQLFGDFATTMANFSILQDKAKEYSVQNSIKQNSVDVTSLTTVMQSAKLSAMDNGNLNLRMESKGEFINHPLNESESAALRNILDKTGISDVERFRELRAMFTKIGISEQMSQNFNREMSQNQSVDFGIHR